MLPIGIIAQLFYTLLLILGYRKQVINKNFNKAYPQKITSNENNSFYKGCLRSLARYAAEFLNFKKSSSFPKITYQDLTSIEEEAKKKNGLILLASHFGNWEIICSLLASKTSLPCYGVYKPIKDPIIDKIVVEIRSSKGLNLIPMNSIARIISQNTTQQVPSIYILISDQNPRSIANTVWIDFLGIKTAYTNGAQKLHNRYHLPVAYMETTPNFGYNNYEVKFYLAPQNMSKNIMNWYSGILEEQINRNPLYWLWSHKRWKRKYKKVDLK